MTKPTGHYVLPTLGLRLGFLFGFMVLVLPSLLRVYIAFRLNYQQEDLWQRLPFDGWTVLLGLAAVAYGVATFMAWRGRPHGIFWAFQASLVLMMAIIVLESLIRYYGDYDSRFVLNDPSNDVFNRLYRYLMVFQGLICIYMLWYINRAPARQFFDQFKEQ